LEGGKAFSRGKIRGLISVRQVRPSGKSNLLCRCNWDGIKSGRQARSGASLSKLDVPRSMRKEPMRSGFCPLPV